MPIQASKLTEKSGLEMVRPLHRDIRLFMQTYFRFAVTVSLMDFSADAMGYACGTVRVLSRSTVLWDRRGLDLPFSRTQGCESCTFGPAVLLI